MSKRTPKEKFDCLDFKDKAQLEVAKETANLSFEQYKAYLRDSAESGPLGDFYRQIVEANRPRKRTRKVR